MSAARFDHADDARAYAEKVFRARVGTPVAVSAIPNSRNFLFRFDDGSDRAYVVKVYSRTVELIGNCEAIAYDRLRDQSFVRACLGIHRGDSETPAWAIFEYVPGTTVLDSLDRLQADPAFEQDVTRQIARFVRDCTAIPVSGYGDLDARLRGEHPSWPAFLGHFLHHLAESVGKVDDVPVRALMQRGMACLHRFMTDMSTFLRARPSAFVPVDLNMANFLIDPSDRLVALDLENFLAADPLLALGEWTGHTAGTSRHAAFLAAWGPLSEDESVCARAYALLCNMDVLMYIVNNRVSPAAEARPWGNPNLFVDLIEGHIQWLDVHI